MESARTGEDCVPTFCCTCIFKMSRLCLQGFNTSYKRYCDNALIIQKRILWQRFDNIKKLLHGWGVWSIGRIGLNLAYWIDPVGRFSPTSVDQRLELAYSNGINSIRHVANCDTSILLQSAACKPPCASVSSPHETSVSLCPCHRNKALHFGLLLPCSDNVVTKKQTDQDITHNEKLELTLALYMHKKQLFNNLHTVHLLHI
jgi:hypothetical protein